MKRRYWIVAGVSAAALLGWTSAGAQTDAPARTEGKLDEIIVTAERRAANIQDIPLSVTAFSPEIVEALQAGDALAITRFVPAMVSWNNTGQGSANSYFLRGLGSVESVPTFDAPVGTYVDDVYVTRQSSNNYSFFDVDRIEVLRGPQGTLFGRNTSAGAVSIHLKKPSPDFGFFAEGGVGSYEHYEARGSIDAPINDRVLTKFSAYVVQEEGWLDNIATGEKFNGEEGWGARFDLRFLPTDAITWDIALEATSQDQTSIAMRNNTATNEPIYYEMLDAVRKGDCEDDPLVDLVLNQRGNCSVADNSAITSNIGIEFGGAALNYIFGYRALDQIYSVDLYPGPTATAITSPYGRYVITSDMENDQWSHEVKIAGDALEKISYVGGLYYLREENDTIFADLFTSRTASTASANPLLIADRRLINSAQTYAIYLQADIDLTDALTLTLGGRNTWESKKIGYGPLTPRRFTGITTTATAFTTNTLLANGIPIKQNFERFTPRVALQWNVQDDVRFFASYTEGFKSGGWNARVTNILSTLPFKAEESTSVELGLKSELFEDTLRFNATIFRSETENLQVNRSIPVAGVTGLQSLQDNAGTQVVDGLEIEAFYVASPNLDLFFNGALMNARYTYVIPQPLAAAASQITTETDPARAPDISFSAGAIYSQPVAAVAGEVGASVVARFLGPYWTTNANTVNTRTDANTYLDLALRYKNDGGKWSAALECTNCTGVEEFTSQLIGYYYAQDPVRGLFTIRYEY